MIKKIEDELQEKKLNWSLVAELNNEDHYQRSSIQDLPKKTRFRRNYIKVKTDQPKISSLSDCVSRYHNLNQARI